MGTKHVQNGLGGREGAGGIEGCRGETRSRRGLGFAAQPGPVLFPIPSPRLLPAAPSLSFPPWSGRFVPQNPVGASGNSDVGGYGIFLFTDGGGGSSHELPWGCLCLITPTLQISLGGEKIF